MEEMERRGYLAGLAAAMAAVGWDGEGDVEERLVGFAEHIEGRTRAAVEEAVFAEQMLREKVERKTLVMEMGVPAERAERYVRLAGTYMRDGVDFAAALDEAVRDFPAGPGDGVPRVAGKATGTAPERTWKEMGLGERARVYREDPERARGMAAACGERV